MTEAERARTGRPRRASHWDRPPPPHDLSWVLGIVGRSLIVLGLLTLTFAAYQLWGTGIETTRAQRSLEGEFEQLLASSPPGGDTTIGTFTSVGVGGAIHRPDDWAILHVTAEWTAEHSPRDGAVQHDLKRGPGHYPHTPLPGQLGNAAITGHRTSYGEPFAYIDQLQAGDEITVTTPAGTFIYVVDDSRIVSPSDTYVLDTDDSASRLTLTSCHPRYSASQRIAVSAGLAGTRSSPVGEPLINYGRPSVDGDETGPAVDTIPGEPVDPASMSGAPPNTSSGTPPDTSSVGTEPDIGGSAGPRTPDPEPDAFSDGWFADRGAYPHVATTTSRSSSDMRRCAV